MDKKLKARWIKELVSGQKKQGHLRLRQWRPDGLHQCCMDILREVAKDKRCRPGALQLSKEQLRDYGMTPNQQCILVEMNDNERATFGKIASWIRSNL